MAVSFACPACKTLIQVGEEMSGQTGQCPRCERLLIIPSASVPVATLLDSAGKPVPAAPPTPARKPTPKIIDDAPPRSPRRSVERKPAGPSWPWTVGILGGIVVFILLFSSFITLFAYRPRQERTNLIVVDQKPWQIDVNRGQLLEGGKAVLDEDGIFRLRTGIARHDERDHGDGAFGRFRTRRYQIELQPGEYTIEVAFEKSSSFLRIEEPERNFRGSHHGGRVLLVPHRCQKACLIALNVGNQEDVNDSFTLTVRRVEHFK